MPPCQPLTLRLTSLRVRGTPCQVLCHHGPVDFGGVGESAGPPSLSAARFSLETASRSMNPSLTRMDVVLQLASVRVWITHPCVQAGLPSNEARRILLADRWSIRAGHRLLLAAGCTHLFPMWTGVQASAIGVRHPGGLGEINGLFDGQSLTQGGAQCHLEPARTPHAPARTTPVYLS